MTIDFKMINSSDLFEPNESFNFYERKFLFDKNPLPKLSAITFLSEELSLPRDMNQLDKNNVVELKNFLLSKKILEDGWCIYLFLSIGDWEVKNRINMHKKLWKSSSIVQKNIYNGDRSDDILFECDNKVRFAGVVKIDIVDLCEAITVMRSNASSILFLSKDKSFLHSENINELFCSAFPVYKGLPECSVNWQHFLVSYPLEESVAVRVSGHYDDRCTAIDLIGLSSVIEKLK